MSKSENLIAVEELWHIYAGNVEALKGINLNIRRSEVTAIVGQNGSGKTTLVKHFNGLLRPTRGRVLLEGAETKTYKPKEIVRKVGYVFQNPTHQLFCTSIEEEIAFGPRNLGLEQSEVKQRVEDAIMAFRLDKYRDIHPLRLSFPLRKMLAIASVYVMHPDALVLDEPTTGQDHVGIALIERTINQLKSEGRTLILVSHDMPLVAGTADRAVVMRDGAVVADAHPKELFSNDSLMKETHLMPPQVTRLSQMFTDPRIPHNVLTVDEMFSTLEKIHK